MSVEDTVLGMSRSEFEALALALIDRFPDRCKILCGLEEVKQIVSRKAK